MSNLRNTYQLYSMAFHCFISSCFLICRGWGLRCLDDIPRGTFICTYSGQILNEEMADKVISLFVFFVVNINYHLLLSLMFLVTVVDTLIYDFWKDVLWPLNLCSL